MLFELEIFLLKISVFFNGKELPVLGNFFAKFAAQITGLSFRKTRFLNCFVREEYIEAFRSFKTFQQIIDTLFYTVTVSKRLQNGRRKN